MANFLTNFRRFSTNIYRKLNKINWKLGKNLIKIGTKRWKFVKIGTFVKFLLEFRRLSTIFSIFQSSSSKISRFRIKLFIRKIRSIIRIRVSNLYALRRQFADIFLNTSVTFVVVNGSKNGLQFIIARSLDYIFNMLDEIS